MALETSLALNVSVASQFYVHQNLPLVQQNTLHLKKLGRVRGLDPLALRTAPGSDVDSSSPPGPRRRRLPLVERQLLTAIVPRKHIEPIKSYLIDRVNVHSFLYPFLPNPPLRLCFAYLVKIDVRWALRGSHCGWSITRHHRSRSPRHH
jgi:hypothetical protein